MQVSYFKFQEKKKCETLSMRNLISTSFPMYVFNYNTQVARESGVTQDDINNTFAAASLFVRITCFSFNCLQFISNTK